MTSLLAVFLFGLASLVLAMVALAAVWGRVPDEADAPPQSSPTSLDASRPDARTARQEATLRHSPAPDYGHAGPDYFVPPFE